MTTIVRETNTPTITKKHTFGDLRCLTTSDKEYELIEGELVEMPGPSIKHGVVVARLDRYLGSFVDEGRLGEVMSNTAFILDPENALRPDVAFVVQGRLVGVDFNDAFPGRPDLAIEVISRTDMVYDVDTKVATYLQAQVPGVWLVNPQSKLVFVYKSGEIKPLVLAGDDELVDEDLLPGFKLKVSGLFE